jgi:myo-inositol catabolism protein IolS
MQYRKLGGTDMVVSVVGVGTWQFGGEWGIDFTQADVDAIFDAGRECGINLIDTAECYGHHLSEEFIGRAIARDREKWIVATKFGHVFHKPFERTTVYDPDAVLEQFEGSLKALGTDYIDLYQFHSGNDEHFATPGLWELMAEQMEKGRIRALGISISSGGDRTGQVEGASGVGASSIQVVYNRLDRGPEEKVLPSCQAQELGVLARVPLASGYLSGKYKPGHTFPENDVREAWYKDGRDEKLAEVQRIAAEEVPEGVPLPQWALAWCLKNPAVTGVIPGCKNVEQVRSNAAAADLDIAQDDHPQAAEAP